MFKKGQSGNPGGRPKDDAGVSKLAKSFSVEAINRLAFWMRSKNPKASVAACNAILDRGLGKAVQALQVGSEDGGPLVVKIVKFSEKK